MAGGLLGRKSSLRSWDPGEQQEPLVRKGLKWTMMEVQMLLSYVTPTFLW